MDMSGIQDLDQYGGQRPPVVTFEPRTDQFWDYFFGIKVHEVN